MYGTERSRRVFVNLFCTGRDSARRIAWCGTTWCLMIQGNATLKRHVGTKCSTLLFRLDVKGFLCFSLNGEERAAAHRKQETAEGPFGPVAPAPAASWPHSGRHGAGARKTAALRQLLRIRGPASRSVGVASDMPCFGYIVGRFGQKVRETPGLRSDPFGLYLRETCLDGTRVRIVSACIGTRLRAPGSGKPSHNSPERRMRRPSHYPLREPVVVLRLRCGTVKRHIIFAKSVQVFDWLCRHRTDNGGRSQRDISTREGIRWPDSGRPSPPFLTSRYGAASGVNTVTRTRIDSFGPAEPAYSTDSERS